MAIESGTRYPVSVESYVQTLKGYLAIQRTLLDKELFVERHPHSFLIQTSHPYPDEVKGRSRFVTQIDENHAEQGKNRSPSGDILTSWVFPIVSCDTQRFEGIVSVGRTTSNDIVIDYPVISKLHAHFSRSPGMNDCILTDANSANRTIVNGVSLEPRQSRELNDGDLVAFGVFEFAYHTASGFFDLLEKLR